MTPAYHTDSQDRLRQLERLSASDPSDDNLLSLFALRWRLGQAEGVPILTCKCGWVGAPALQFRKKGSEKAGFHARCRSQTGCDKGQRLPRQEPWVWLFGLVGGRSKQEERRLMVDSAVLGNAKAAEKLAHLRHQAVKDEQRLDFQTLTAKQWNDKYVLREFAD